MKEYNINISTDGEKYYIMDFTITRPVVGQAVNEQEAVAFAKGYKAGIEIDSSLKFQPVIKDIEIVKDIKEHIKNKKRYYDELWKTQK